MTNPTSGWDPVPVTGKWLNIDQSPKSGKIRFTLTARVIMTDGTAIYPRGGTITATLGAETGSIATAFPASDDPNIAPTGWKVKVEEQLTDGSGQTYYIEPKLADLPDGVNLNLVVVADDAPATPPPVYMRGVAGGLAALNSAGQVVDAAGNPVTGGAASYLSSLADTDMTGVTVGQAPVWDGSKYVPGNSGGATALASLTDVNSAGRADGKVLAWDADTSKNVYVTPPAGGSAAWTDITGKPSFATVATSGAYSDLSGTPSLAAVATTGSYNSLTDKPSIPAAAGEVGAVPEGRKVNGKTLNVDITLDAADVSAVPTSRMIAGKPLTGDVTLTAADVSAVAAGSLATVATSGSYTNLIDKPTIPTGADQIGGVLASRKINGHDLTADFSLSAGDVSAVASSAVGSANGVAGLDASGMLSLAVLPSALTLDVRESGGTYAGRPAWPGRVNWIGVDPPASGGTTAGGAGAVAGLDSWTRSVA